MLFLVVDMVDLLSNLFISYKPVRFLNTWSYSFIGQFGHLVCFLDQYRKFSGKAVLNLFHTYNIYKYFISGVIIFFHLFLLLATVLQSVHEIVLQCNIFINGRVNYNTRTSVNNNPHKINTIHHKLSDSTCKT